jgi:hypothetical protein
LIGSTFPFFRIAFHLGRSGSAVSGLQRLLAIKPVIYPQDTVTEHSGTLTLKAVQRFQTKCRILKRLRCVGPANRQSSTRSSNNA